MKRILYILIIFLFISNTSAKAEDFIAGFEDIPLMSGFRQQENQTFSFGNEETGYSESIIETQKKIKFDNVKSFYADILPKFGWYLKESNSNNLIFLRDNDILEISELSSSPLKVSISLKSKN